MSDCYPSSRLATVRKTVCFYCGMQRYAVPAFVIIKNANQDKIGFHSPYFPCDTHRFLGGNKKDVTVSYHRNILNFKVPSEITF